MKNQYNKTVTACFVGYIVQAIVNNFTPLLFLFFQRSYQIPLSQITLLVTFNFGIQLLVDLLSVGFVDRIGYRISIVAAHVLAAAGLALLTVLPEVTATPFTGILISVMIYAIGGGLLEVLVSPVVEACPSDNKEKAMSMLHSFYCWGHAGVVLLSTLFFYVVGIENWKMLALLWAVVPMVNAFVFARVPIATLMEDGESGLTPADLLDPACDDDMRRGKRTGGKPVGLHIRGAGTWHLQDGGRSGRAAGVCSPDGDVQTVLRQIRRPHSSGTVYGLQQLPVHFVLSGDLTFSGSAAEPACLCGLRPVGGNHVAGNI